MRVFVIVSAGELGKGRSEILAKGPILVAAKVTFKDGIHDELVGITATQQRVRSFIGPIQAEGRREGDEEVVERERRPAMRRTAGTADVGTCARACACACAVRLCGVRHSASTPCGDPRR